MPENRIAPSTRDGKVCVLWGKSGVKAMRRHAESQMVTGAAEESPGTFRRMRTYEDDIMEIGDEF